jgi:hypothetical protein
MGQAIQKLKGSAHVTCENRPKDDPKLLILLKKPIKS